MTFDKFVDNLVGNTEVVEGIDNQSRFFNDENGKIGVYKVFTAVDLSAVEKYLTEKAEIELPKQNGSIAADLHIKSAKKAALIKNLASDFDLYEESLQLMTGSLSSMLKM